MQYLLFRSPAATAFFIYAYMQIVRFLLLALLANTSPTWAVTPLPQPAWQDWSPQVFAQARAEKKLVLLDMAAVWCHWCHVMDEKTYADPAVLAELQQHYRVIRVDQDARPDLSNRYKDYGWPATILFDAQGRELVKRAGYIERNEFLSLLQATYKRPEPEAEAQTPKHRIGSSSQLTPALRSASLVSGSYCFRLNMGSPPAALSCISGVMSRT